MRIFFSILLAQGFIRAHIDELEPRIFSFDNSAGACPGCDGLGVKPYFDIDRVVQYPEYSFSEGNISKGELADYFLGFTLLHCFKRKVLSIFLDISVFFKVIQHLNGGFFD